VQVRFALPPLIDSPLARLDARWRLASLLLALAATAAVRTLPAALAAGLGALAGALLARTPWRWFAARLAVVGLLVAVFVAPMPLLAGNTWQEGWRLAGVPLLKALALFTLAAVLLVSAPLEETLKAARALCVPGLLVQLTLLSYRYLFVLGDELARLRVALRVRGFRNRAGWHSYRTVAAASGTLLVRGGERADRVAAAMRCRGFDGRFRSLAEFSTRPADVLALALALAAAAGVVGLDVFLLHH
jgi:cobalt/nickel transport system permease protein